MVFNAEKFVDEKVQELKQAIDGPVIIAASGGVDSTVSSLLVHKAAGERLHAVFVDTGLLRKGEVETAQKNFERLGLNVKTIDARQRFLDALKGVTDPEEKRKRIGELFIRIFEEEARACKAVYLTQGTIAPDCLESGVGARNSIKSHHNVGGLPKEMCLNLVEPVRDLYKAEVRLVARSLGVPETFFKKQPFPGPGLSVRIVGEVTQKRLDVAREACAIVEEEIEEAAREGKMVLPWQYFAVLLPVKSVGVRGDARVYGYTVVVRAVDSADAMTANYSRVPHDVLKKISLRITNSLQGKEVNRVVLDVTDKPPSTIEWE